MKNLLALFMGVFMLAACSEKVSLEGKTYRLSNTSGESEITLLFDKEENRYAGKAVNNYFGTYQTEGNKISFAPGGMTMMMGPKPMMDAETKYFEQLAKVTEYEVKDNKMQLRTSDGQVLEFEEVAPQE